ncbi:hypothetical protein FRUB_09219 [Fimbriiglobus ruber]|uniref:Uncharacterized protein n=1 Tax=Fimbriiglobus ruber TaxID=1908690 RepID=A0A225DH01_9BACT|nr:hypothetical protein FRUB_09219 [Fimbriiglobus ruber]
MPFSTTYKVPSGAIANAVGSDSPVATAVDTPAGVTLTTRPLESLAYWLPLPESETYKLPAASIAKPAGLSNPDAKTLFTPAGVTLKTVPSP